MKKDNPTKEGNNPTSRLVTIECKHCHKGFKVAVGTLMGKVSSVKKAKAALANGCKGGRPRKDGTAPHGMTPFQKNKRRREMRKAAKKAATTPAK